MSIFSAIFDKRVQNFEQAFGAKDITTPQMKNAINEWFNLYFDAEVPDNEDTSQRLPYAVVNKVTKAVFGEYTASTQEGFCSDVMTNLNKISRQAVQTALIGGECYIKPILSGGGIDFVVVRRDGYFVLARNTNGDVTSVGMAERTVSNGAYYTLLERRSVELDGRATIEHRLYRSDNSEYMGHGVPLGTLAKYEQLQPTMTLPTPLYNLGMVHMKTPMENCVDGSIDGVSVYAPAVGLIHNINRNEQLINDEFDNGQSRIIASDDMLRRDSSGRRKLSDKLFIGVDDDPSNVPITIFSPALREQSYLARKNEYLRNVETVVGLKRGILSEVEASERTATEVTSSEGDYNLTIIDFQKMWEKAVEEALQICAILGQMYKLCPTKKFDIKKDLVIDWGDGVLYNRERTWAEYLQMVQSGLLKPERALAWYFELPCNTQADMEKIRANYMPELESMTGGE